MGLVQVDGFRCRAGDICRMGLAQVAASGKQTSGAGGEFLRTDGMTAE